MNSNRELLQKKRIAKMKSLPNIELEAEEADKFIDYIVDESELMKHARVVKMTKETKNIRALGLGTTRFLYNGAEFTSANYKNQFSQNNIQLTSKKGRGAVAIFDDDLEDNPEGAGFADHIMRMVSDTIANELDETFWIGDTASLGGFDAVDLRSVFDGWRYRLINGDTVGDTYANTVSGPCTILDATDGSDFTHTGGIAVQDSSAPYAWEFKFQRMLTSLKSKYKRNPGNLRFYCNQVIIDDYIEALQDRGTAMGDSAISDGSIPNYRGIPLVGCANMSTTLDASDVYDGGAYTDCVLTHKDNFVIGIQRQVKIESQREAADEATYFFYTLRMDLAIENTEAVVMLKSLTHNG